MIIQFVTENYRSIKHEQTLSLVKSTGNEMPDNFFETSAPNTPALVKSAVIYGANASGKSNVIKALESMLTIIRNSSDKKIERDIPTESFLFDVVANNEPTLYDISVIMPLLNDDGILQEMRVDYGFVCDKKMVYEEWLSIYPKGKERNWFHREYNQDKQEYEWKISDHIKGEKASWKNLTRSDQLFLSNAVHFNSEQLEFIYNFFIKSLTIVRTDRIGNFISLKMCQNSEINKNIIISLLQSSGINVHDIIVRKKITDDFSRITEINNLDFLIGYEIFFIYLNNKEKMRLINLQDESDGTQKLFEFAGLILEVFKNGDVLVIDELNKSLHPDLVRFLVKLFNSSLNQKNAQLIFTTHETSVLRKDLLRRDQIWFCEKDNDISTRLYPLTDFKPHINREDIEEYYLHGRYGAKPILTEFQFPNDFWENK